MHHAYIKIGMEIIRFQVVTHICLYSLYHIEKRLVHLGYQFSDALRQYHQLLRCVVSAMSNKIINS